MRLFGRGVDLPVCQRETVCGVVSRSCAISRPLMPPDSLILLSFPSYRCRHGSSFGSAAGCPHYPVVGMWHPRMCFSSVGWEREHHDIHCSQHSRERQASPALAADDSPRALFAKFGRRWRTSGGTTPGTPSGTAILPTGTGLDLSLPTRPRGREDGRARSRGMSPRTSTPSSPPTSVREPETRARSPRVARTLPCGGARVPPRLRPTRPFRTFPPSGGRWRAWLDGRRMDPHSSIEEIDE